METLTTYIDKKNQNQRAVIVADYDSESPRSWDNTCLFHFKDDRTYNLPKEASNIIDFSFFEKDSEYDDDEWKKEKKEYLDELNKNYFIFGMYYMNYSYA